MVIFVGMVFWMDKMLIEFGVFYFFGCNILEVCLRYYVSVFFVVEVDFFYYVMLSVMNSVLWVEWMFEGFVFDFKVFRLFMGY